MRRKLLIFSALLITTSLTASPLIPSSVAYLLVILSYGILFVMFARDDIPVFYYRPILYPVLLIWVLFLFSFILNFERSSVLRLLSFTLLTSVNIFVLPAVIDRWTAYKSIARVSAVFVIIGLPAALFGAFSVGPLTFGVWSFPQHLGLLTYHIPTSIFASPNQLAEIVVLGTVAAGAEWSRTRTPLSAMLVVISVIGVFVSDSRTGWLALVVAAGLYLGYRVYGEWGLVVTSISGLAVFVLLLLGLTDVVLLPIISDISLTGRGTLWEATIKAIEQRPLFGWGLGQDRLVLNHWIPSDSRYYNKGTHNSYLRLFLIGGIVAGISYLVLSLTSLIASLRKVYRNSHSLSVTDSLTEAFCLILLVVFFIIQAFGGSTIYGISPVSTIGAIVVGYTQPRSSIHTVNLSISQERIQQLKSIYLSF